MPDESTCSVCRTVDVVVVVVVIDFDVVVADVVVEVDSKIEMKRRRHNLIFEYKSLKVSLLCVIRLI